MKTILLDPTEAFFPIEGLSSKKVGRKRLLNREKYLEAVKKILSISDTYISKYLGVCRKTVYNFKMNNPHVLEEAKKMISEFDDLSFSKKLEIWEYFFNLPIIQEWYRTLKDIRRVGDRKIDAYIKTFWHICKKLKAHPRTVGLDQCVDLNIKMKNLYYGKNKQPYGLSYSRVRESLRSFFMLMRHVSGDHLSVKGITKETLPTFGRFAKQYVNAEVRKRFVECLRKYASSYNEYLELVYVAKFMFYTATRIMATLTFSFKINNFNLDKSMWMFEVVDKGRNGGTKWEKYLIGHALDEFREYFNKRFKIPIENLDIELPNKVSFIFPILKDNAIKIYKVFKKALIEAGLQYKNFPPNHIWRHTFAQLFLRAGDWNYDLCASLGGWKSTYVLKRAYGEMGLDPKINGLKEAMGLPVEKEKYELKW